MNRIMSVVRLHLTNPWTAIILPWMIMGFILLGNVAVWAIILGAAAPEDRAGIREGFAYGGSVTYFFVYIMVLAVQAISVTFPFAQGYGVTRRDYYVGTALVFTALSAMFSVGLTILSVIEEATGGWGLGGRLFTAYYYGEDWLQRLFIYFTAFLFFFFVGTSAAAIWVRWRANGLTAYFVSLAVIVIGGAALLTFTRTWHIVGNFFAGSGLVGSFAWSLVITAIAAVGGFLVLRRATPKS